MTDIEKDEGDTSFEDSAEGDTPLNLALHLLPSLSERPAEKYKDHCDYLLDAIDEQLDQLQPHSSFKAPLSGTEEVRKLVTSDPCIADMKQSCEIGSQEPKDATSIDSNEQGKYTECKKEEYKWRLTNLLGSEQTDYLEYQNDSNSAESVCTEDFVVKFKQGMVEPIARNNDNEAHENAPYGYGKLNKPLKVLPQNVGLSIPLSEGSVGDHFSLSTARRQDILQQFKEELKDDLQAAFSTSDEGKISMSSKSRRDSVESLGGRISRLSQANVSELSSLLSMEKLSSIGSNLSPRSAVDYQKSLVLLKDHCVDNQVILYPHNTVENREVNRTKVQETNNYFETFANIQSLRKKEGWEDNTSDHNVGLNSSGNQHCFVAVSSRIPILLYGATTDCPKEPIEHKPLENYNDREKSKNIRTSNSPESHGSYAEKFEADWNNRLEDSQKVSYPDYQKTPDEKNTDGICQKINSKFQLTHEDAKYEVTGKPLTGDIAEQHGREEINKRDIHDEQSLTRYKRTQSSLETSFTPHSGHSTRGPCRNRKESLRYPDSSKVLTDDEDGEEFEPLPSTDWGSISPNQWSRPKAADSSWDRTTRNIYSEFMRSPDQGQRRRGPAIEDLATERVILEESVAKLRWGVAVEEEKLSQRKVQFREADQSFNDILQQKKKAYQELESIRDILQKAQKEMVKMESHMKESQVQAEESRSELVLLEYKRSGFLKELQELELDLNSIKQQCSSTNSSQIASFQYEISLLTGEREELKARLRHLEGSLSFLERQELERQLNYAKSELFSEHRTARAKIEELQENLEESQSKLEEKRAESVKIQEKNKQLKLQLCELDKKNETLMQNQAAEASEQKEVLNQQLIKLTLQEREQRVKITSLEKILSEKELVLLRLRDVISSLKADKDAWALATETLKQEQSKQLQEMQLQQQQDKEIQLTKLREELQCQKKTEIQQFAENMEQVKFKALQDQAESLEKEMAQAVKPLEAKDKEIAKLKETFKSQKETMKKLAVELKQEARELVHNTLLHEQKKWESEKRDALQIQRHTMEEQRLRDMADLREVLERERRTSMALEKKSAELQNIIQEQEVHNRSLQREKQEALDELRTLLREEKQEDMKRLQQELEQERGRDVERLKLRLQQLEEEQHILRAEHNEACFREKEAQAQAERAERGLAREISTACERIQSIPGRAKTNSPSHIRHGSPCRISTNQALQMLHGVSEETNQVIHELHQEAEAQKRTVTHVQREKDRELKQQREQLQLEKEKALDVLKERLIQEHIDEITNLQRDQLRESGNGETQSLRQQLREKDNELRVIQRNMAKWKDETATRLACKFEEELNAELEKSLSRSKASDSQRNTERVGSAVRRLSMERRENLHLRSASTPSLTGVAAQHDFGALKILRHLQGRVRELRTDNRLCHASSLENLSMRRTEPGNSYREKWPFMAEPFQGRK
ncbi:uncharacterized protein LOC142464666 isoform X2 [Ascaphus truei]|uniref:uncharacterized protein LOC142464666 isoform X2 n=1 Tax=Ascaphus truei TaxID=8439 RepID=UPI003F593996